MPRHAIRRRLRRYRGQRGNWRLKGLFLALQDDVDAASVGGAWPQREPTQPRDYLALGDRAGEVQEHTHARTLYDADAVRDNRVVPRDEYISRALVNESHTELDVLWREELLASVAAGAQPRKIARDATTVTEVDARRGDIPVHGHEPFATSGAEAGGASFDEGDYRQIQYDVEKHEQGFGLTDELVDEAAPDMLELAVRRAGAAVENAINRQHLINVVDNATQDHQVGGNAVQVKDVFEAAENVTDNDFDPANVLVMHPEFRTEFADKAVFVTDADAEVGDGNHVGPALFVASGATYNGLSDEHPPSTTNTWGWENSTEIGAVVYGMPYVHTVVYRDVGITELGDWPVTAIHDLQGGIARASTDSVQASTDAISTITQ